jgi:hypothetical protein
VPRALQVAAGTFALLILVSALVVLRLRRDLEPEIQARRGFVDSVQVSGEVRGGGVLRYLVTLRSTSGLAVDLAILRPVSGCHPLAILIGGHETGRDAIGLLQDTRGVAVAALSYPYRGSSHPKGLAFVGSVPAIQQGIRDTPAAILLALDWLAAEPWVDPHRIDLVGVSLGAPFACVAGALDPRFERVWSIHGAADPRLLIEHSLRRKVPSDSLRSMASSLASLLAYGDRLAPEKWVARIAPRPFLMVNASDDERLPRAAVLSLYESAREPKELHWTEGGHVRPRKAEVIAGLVDLVLARIAGPDPR